MYDPSIGRWLEEDPEGFAGGDSNLYRYVENSPTNHTDPSGMLESDDRANAPGNARLVNVDTILERRVNEAIQERRTEFQRQLNRLSRTEREDLITRNRYALGFIRAVYQDLGADVPGSGVNTPVGSVVQVTGIEHWLKNNLHAADGEINQIPFLQSRYRFNLTGRGVESPAPLWFATSDLNILNHGIAPTIRVSGTLMGTDKWGHFFQQGYWLFQLFMENQLQTEESRLAFSRFLEGNYDPAGRPAGEIGLFERFARRYGTSSGLLGGRASGVISEADIRANSAGFSFYNSLYAAFMSSRDFTFRVSDYPTRTFNEAVVTPNSYVRGTSVDDTPRAGPTTPRTPPDSPLIP